MHYKQTMCFLCFFIPSFVNAGCFDKVGQAFSISPVLLQAIAIVESNQKLHAINYTNKNKTQDLCMMGVNSSHFSYLKKLGVNRENILNNECICVATGAWVLNDLFAKYGKSWDTIGMYNTGPSSKMKKRRNIYEQKVKKVIVLLKTNQNDNENYIVRR